MQSPVCVLDKGLTKSSCPSDLKTSPSRQFPYPFQVESPQRVLGRRCENLYLQESTGEPRVLHTMCNHCPLANVTGHTQHKKTLPCL